MTERPEDTPPPEPPDDALPPQAEHGPSARAPSDEPRPPAIELVPESVPEPPLETVLPSARHDRLRYFFSTLGLAAAAFLFGLLVFNYAVMPRLVHTDREVKVPDLSNLTVDQAERALTAAGLTLSRSGERYDTTVPRGFVIGQDPPPGTPVRGGRRVAVLVSLGEEFGNVPELTGESLRGARLLLERAGLDVGAMVYAPSDQMGEGLIAGSDPGPDRVVPRGTAVALLVSTGAPSELFVMPELVGREVGGVRRQLEALGFNVVTPPSMPGMGTIVSQDPPAGARIARRATILITATGRMIR
jgi:eukaryotic-like serine/threonine-protein kinase